MNSAQLTALVLEQLQKYLQAAEQQHGAEFLQQFAEVPELALEDYALWLQAQFESPVGMQSRVQ